MIRVDHRQHACDVAGHVIGCLAQCGHVELMQFGPNGPRLLVRRRGSEQPDRRQHPRQRRDDERPDTHASREHMSVDRAGSAERNHDDIVGRSAAFNDVLRDCRSHVLDDNLLDALRNVQGGCIVRASNRVESLSRSSGVKADLAAEKVVGGEMPSYQGRVRNSGILASAHVTRRAWYRTGTVRTYAKYANFVSRDDAAPTRTELDHVDRRNAQWESG